MDINKTTGWLKNVRKIKSPNYEKRDYREVDLLVIHNMSLPPGQFGGKDIDALFQNRLDFQKDPFYQNLIDTKVSAHALIRRAGEITQYVSFYDMAWHAGESQFENRDRCNRFSVGIELEGTDTMAYEPIQYDQLAQLVFSLINFFPKITLERIVGHQDIAPGRKTDPGPAFDWQLFRKKLQLLYHLHR